VGVAEISIGQENIFALLSFRRPPRRCWSWEPQTTQDHLQLSACRVHFRTDLLL